MQRRVIFNWTKKTGKRIGKRFSGISDSRREDLVSLPKQTGELGGGVLVQSEHISGSSLMSFAKRKRIERIKSSCAQEKPVISKSARRQCCCVDHLQFRFNQWKGQEGEKKEQFLHPKRT